MLGAILAFSFAMTSAAAEPPAGLLKLIAERETENEAARNQYMYRQTVVVEDLDKNGGRLGEFREIRDIIFTPEGKRIEETVGRPLNTLKRLRMTEEDMRDIREIQPLLITRETLFLYEGTYRGEEQMDGIDCWLMQVRPRQILSGQRYFDGTVWVDQRDYSIVRLEGRAVPQIQSTKEENLFPHFTTLRETVDGKFWFPVKTFGEDTLYFRTGPQRIRMTIRYANYKRFATDSKIEYK
jgi:hypothetical protein